MKPVFVYMHHWYCGGTQTKPEQTHRRYLKLLIQQSAGIYNATLPLLGDYHQRYGEQVFFLCPVGHKQSTTLCKIMTDLTKILNNFFSVTSNVGSQAVGCFKSYQHQESAQYVSYHLKSAAGHLALLSKQTSCYLSIDGQDQHFLASFDIVSLTDLPRRT